VKTGTKIEKKKEIKKVIKAKRVKKIQAKYIRCLQPYLLQQAVRRAPINANKLNKMITP